MKKINLRTGFSLAEMMVVLLIVAIVAAASAPMITRKIVRSAGDSSPWLWTGLNGSIAYNLDNKTITAAIGADGDLSNSHSKLFINSDEFGVYPQITLGSGKTYLKMIFDSKGKDLWVSTEGRDRTINRGTNIGRTVFGVGAKATNAEGVAIGHDAEAQGKAAIAIGGKGDTTLQAIAKKEGAIAIGCNTKANDTHSIAIGTGAEATGNYAVAIGYNAKATTSNQIVLGTADDTVYIPGKLLVDSTVQLGTKEGSYVGIRAYQGNNFRQGHIKYIDKDDMTYLSMDSTTAISDDELPEGASTGGPGGGTGGGSPQGKIDNSVEDGITINDIDHTYTGGWGSDNPNGGYFEHIYSDDPTSLQDANGRKCDIRLKNVGKVFKGGLEQVKKLEVFHFTYKADEDKTPHVGVIAQDLMKIFPDAVWKGEDGFYRIRMEDMFYAVINAIKELDLRLTRNDKRVADLEEQNAQLVKQINALEKRLEKLEKRAK